MLACTPLLHVAQQARQGCALVQEELDVAVRFVGPGQGIGQRLDRLRSVTSGVVGERLQEADLEHAPQAPPVRAG